MSAAACGHHLRVQPASARGLKPSIHGAWSTRA
jgi:hypothetical protein